jgi:hypothetical protein
MSTYNIFPDVASATSLRVAFYPAKTEISASIAGTEGSTKIINKSLNNNEINKQNSLVSVSKPIIDTKNFRKSVHYYTYDRPFMVNSMISNGLFMPYLPLNSDKNRQKITSQQIFYLITLPDEGN